MRLHRYTCDLCYGAAIKISVPPSMAPTPVWPPTPAHVKLLWKSQSSRSRTLYSSFFAFFVFLWVSYRWTRVSSRAPRWRCSHNRKGFTVVCNPRHKESNSDSRGFVWVMGLLKGVYFGEENYCVWRTFKKNIFHFWLVPDTKIHYNLQV